MSNPEFQPQSKRKNFYEELERLEREGYDKTRFCDAECVLIHCCDHCSHYDFKPGDCGCYLDAGQCSIHGKKDPEAGNGCEDYICARLRERPEYKKRERERIKEKIFLARQGENICSDCWASVFCEALKEGEEDESYDDED